MIRNRLIFSEILLCAIVLAICGCSSDNYVSVIGTGRIMPSISVNPEVEDPGYSEPKVTVKNIPDVSEVSLTISSSDGMYSHTWDKFSDFDNNTSLTPGSYLVEANYGSSFSEGFDSPWYHAESKVALSSGEEIPVPLECKISNTLLTLHFTDDFKNNFSGCKAIVHSSGGDYLDFPIGESRPIYLIPGKVSVILQLVLKGGEELRFEAAQLPDALPACVYNLEFVIDKNDSSGYDAIVVSYDSFTDLDDRKIVLSPEFINSPVAEINCTGFVSGETVSIIEGSLPDQNLVFGFDKAEAAEVMMSLNTYSPALSGLPKEFDLLSASTQVLTTLRNEGLEIRESGTKVELDFTRLVANLRINGNHNQTLIGLVAVNQFGKVSEPRTLDVSLIAPEVEIVSVPESLIGINKAEIVVQSNVDITGLCTIDILGSDLVWHSVTIDEISRTAADKYTLAFEIPSGELPVICRLSYLGTEIKQFTIKRSSPQFNIEVDAYATKAYVTVFGESKEMTELITSYANVFANGRQVSVIERDKSNGVLLVAGLSDNTRYSFQVSVFEHPTSEADFSPVFNTVTERSGQLPNSSFEDVSNSIKFKNMPSGGLYSQTIVPIFNLQNYTSFDLSVPKEWANVNSKTFCGYASNKNTWYLQPSTYIVNDCYSGGYAVKLVSVAWDINGEKIKDYLQESQPYVEYSRNVPKIAHRAAGKLFLGGYTFNPSDGTESYDEGMNFQSRPSALNGFYKYLPSQVQPSDFGLVKVELIGNIDGRDVVIASGHESLNSTGSYKAFSVPLNYKYLHVKATRLKIMFSSTGNAGDINFESSKILTYSNPATSTSLGSELWLDELSLSY